MNKEDLKKLIVETIQEVDFDEQSEVKLIQSIASLARTAIGRDNPQLYKRYMTEIDSLAEHLLKMMGRLAQEGYGTGDPKTDPKFAGNWKVHFPSEKDWKKNKKSLSKVFEISPPNQHEGAEMQIYKSVVMVASKLIQLHSTSNYDEKEEDRLHKALQQLVGKLSELERSEPEHPGNA